ncbi:MAG: GNAT family N-acetyltransferase [Anaerolineae bacterium]
MAKGFEKDLGDGLVLRSVCDESDIERFATFQFDMFHNTECVTVDRLLHYHPEVTPDDFFFVEDTGNSRIASTTCFVPWHCRYDDVELRVAQLEVVATHPDYRRRGLVREQIRHFHDLADERGYEMTAIGGIPYYYRQFGYAHAVDQGRAWVVPAYAQPEGAGGAGYRLRPATADDAEDLTRFYEAGMQPVQFHDRRSLEFWRYLMRRAMWPATIVEDAAGQAVGYVSATPAAGGAAVYVSECGIAGHDAAMAALHLLGAGDGPSGPRRDVIVSCPPRSTLSVIAASIGAASPRWYQWLLRIASLERFLRSVAPVLERRLADSHFAGLSGTYRFNNFHEAVDIGFAAGRVADVTGLGFVPHSNDDSGGDFVLPPDAFVRLVVGYRTLEQLRDPWPDIVVRPELEPLLETLFPGMTSFLYLPYSYRGPVPDTAAGALSRNLTPQGEA